MLEHARTIAAGQTWLNNMVSHAEVARESNYNVGTIWPLHDALHLLGNVNFMSHLWVLQFVINKPETRFPRSQTIDYGWQNEAFNKHLMQRGLKSEAWSLRARSLRYPEAKDGIYNRLISTFMQHVCASARKTVFYVRAAYDILFYVRVGWRWRSALRQHLKQAVKYKLLRLSSYTSLARWPRPGYIYIYWFKM